MIYGNPSRAAWEAASAAGMGSMMPDPNQIARIRALTAQGGPGGPPGGGDISVPVAGSNPNMINNIETISVMRTKGINTIIQDITPRPLLHSTFRAKIGHILWELWLNIRP